MARPGLTGHRKFRRLARMLGAPIIARGALELLWESCYESGEDYVGTSEDIETLIGWGGEAGTLTHALVEAGAPEGRGFIEPVSDAVNGAVAYRVHDLWHHAPDYVAKRRKREMDRQQKTAPEPVRRTAPNGGQWSEISNCQIEVDRTPSPSHSPSHLRKNVSSELFTANVVFLEFPVVGTGAPTWALVEAQVEEWRGLFPGLDVRAEARKALAWQRANPGRRKTARGMPRFLVAWLGRAIDAGRATSATPRRSDGVVSGSTCQHDPQCRNGRLCVQRTLAEGREAS